MSGKKDNDEDIEITLGRRELAAIAESFSTICDKDILKIQDFHQAHAYRYIKALIILLKSRHITPNFDVKID